MEKGKERLRMKMPSIVSLGSLLLSYGAKMKDVSFWPETVVNCGHYYLSPFPRSPFAALTDIN